MTPDQITVLKEAKRLCTEIGLQTYDRKPECMTQTADWQKLQQADRMVRMVRDMIGKVLP